MNLFKKIMLFAGIGICAIGTMPMHTKAEQVGTFAGYPIFDNQFGGVNIEEGEGDVRAAKRGAGYSSVHDPRSIGAISNVENQGSTNTCWAFATIAAIESNLIKKGYENNNVNLSENHLAYFFYNRQTDPVGYTAGDKNTAPTFTHWAQNGGTLQGTALALTTWAGVVKANTSEDNSSGEYVPNALSVEDCYKSDYRVSNVHFMNYDVNTIKQAILDYGAVASGIYIDNAYLSADEEAYYCPDEGGNHAIAIVGWDDNYSRDHFNSRYKPKSDGAWIVKNSYGPYHHDNGYMYVSYEDASLCEIVAYDMVSASESFDKNYQYDGTAALDIYYYQPSGTMFSNVFQVKSSNYNEELKAVSIDVLTSGVGYTVQIYTGLTGSSPTSGTLVHTQTGTLTRAGYNQILLDKSITLTPKEKYSVVIKLSSSGGDNVKVGCDASMNGGWILFTANIGKNQSFVKSGGKWYDTGKESGASYISVYGDNDNGRATYLANVYTNVRIKAYTDNTNQKTTYKLSSKNVSLSKGSSTKLSLKISPASVSRKVTWSSSDKKVATVSSSGKVKAKAYGTTTIKAKFVAGKNTKTLSCKVTVGPSKIKNLKVKGGKNKITVTWKKNSAASGYVIYYSTKKDGKYKTLTTIKKNSKTKYTKKLKQGTYYIKMRPYMTKNDKKLYGSYTSVKTVSIK